MMRIITITHNNNMPGNYHVTFKDQGEKQASIKYCNDAGDAAAVAMDLAISYSGEYLILGSNNVISLIPPHLRNGKH